MNWRREIRCPRLSLQWRMGGGGGGERSEEGAGGMLDYGRSVSLVDLIRLPRDIDLLINRFVAHCVLLCVPHDRALVLVTSSSSSSSAAAAEAATAAAADIPSIQCGYATHQNATENGERERERVRVVRRKKEYIGVSARLWR